MIHAHLYTHTHTREARALASHVTLETRNDSVRRVPDAVCMEIKYIFINGSRAVGPGVSARVCGADEVGTIVDRQK